MTVARGGRSCVTSQVLRYVDILLLMSIQDWGAIGEIIGGIGVIATLIYLAMQIRANTTATKGATENAILRDGRDLVTLSFKDRESAELFLKGSRDFNSLDDVDRAIFTNRVAPYFLFWYDAFSQNQKGLVSQDLWKTFERDIPGFFENPGFHDAWELIRNSFPEDFRDYVDMLAKMDGSQSPNYLATRKGKDIA